MFTRFVNVYVKDLSDSILRLVYSILESAVMYVKIKQRPKM